MSSARDERRRGRLAAALGLTAMLLALSACGGGKGGAEGGGGPPHAAQEVGAGTIAIGVRDSEVGPILVDSQGMSLYVFLADVDGKTACGIDCAQYWPSLSLPPGAKTRAGSGVQASLLGRGQKVGPNQLLTYAGHPLYTYAHDGEPGDTTGQDVEQFGGVWQLLSPSGEPIAARTADSLAPPGAG